MSKYFIYLGENPTEFVGIDVNIKKHFMIELDEEANESRIAEFVKSGKLLEIPKDDFKNYQKQGIDRKRESVRQYLEKKKHDIPPEKPKTTTSNKRRSTAERLDI